MNKIPTNQPNFFIVGAPKSGTTNMSYYLIQHPEIFMPEELEPYYFARLDIPPNYQREIISDKKRIRPTKSEVNRLLCNNSKLTVIFFSFLNLIILSIRSYN